MYTPQDDPKKQRHSAPPPLSHCENAEAEDTVLPQTRLTLPSYAKVNIGLRIVGKRPDGYHDLETIFQQIGLHDTLTIEIAESTGQPQMTMTTDDPSLPVDSRNLAVRAAELFLEKSHKQLSVKIDLKKVIPTGAGLGGGSSNAATTLLALNRLTGQALPKATLYECATQLGAAVPFFLTGGLAWATGIGEVLTPIERVPEYLIVVVVPPVSISTKWAYTNLKIRLTNTKNNLKLSHFLRMQNDLSDWPTNLTNDFEPLVFGKHRILKEIKDDLFKTGANYASLSGSGSALFGIFDREETARDGVDYFRPQYSTFLTKPIQFGLNEIQDIRGRSTTK